MQEKRSREEEFSLFLKDDKVTDEYSNLTAFQLAIAQNDAIDILLSIDELTTLTQELYASSHGKDEKSNFLSKGFSKLRNLVGSKKFNFQPVPTNSPLTLHTGIQNSEGEQRKVFEIALDQHELIPVGNLMIPKPLLSMMDGIRGKGLQSEGIFRISANFKKVKELREMLDLGKSITEMEGLTVFDYADLFKLFLRSLPDPLVPENLTALYISSALLLDKEGEEDSSVIKVLQLFHLVLPKVNRHVCQAIIKFFHEISQKSEINKMDSLNIAKVMVPNICNYEKEAPQEPEALFLIHKRMAKLLSFAIDHWDVVFELPLCVTEKLYQEPTRNYLFQDPNETDKENHKVQESPMKHKKILELLDGDNTPRKKLKLDSPIQSPSSPFSSLSPFKRKKKSKFRTEETPIFNAGNFHFQDIGH